MGNQAKTGKASGKRAMIRVNLRIGFFENRMYEAYADSKALRFANDQDTLEIPYDTIVRFTLNGTSLLSDGFTLETEDSEYCGRFNSLEDAKRLLACVGDKMQGRLTLNITRM